MTPRVYQATSNVYHIQYQQQDLSRYHQSNVVISHIKHLYRWQMGPHLTRSLVRIPLTSCTLNSEFIVQLTMYVVIFSSVVLMEHSPLMNSSKFSSINILTMLLHYFFMIISTSILPRTTIENINHTPKQNILFTKQ